MARTVVSRTIGAPPARVYRAFTDPGAVIRWLPPGSMTGVMHAFEPREGGAFSMSLHYPDGEGPGRGKTTEHSDRFEGRFARLVPDARVEWIVRFESADPSFAGEMTVVTTIAPAPAGSLVTMLCEDIPTGIDPADNETGSRQSLDQLAAFLEGCGPG